MKESADTLGFIGKRLAGYRMLAGFTQSELAERSKISRSTIAAIESGSADPKLTTIISICSGISSSTWEMLINDLWNLHLKRVVDQNDENGCSNLSQEHINAAVGKTIGSIGAIMGGFWGYGFKK